MLSLCAYVYAVSTLASRGHWSPWNGWNGWLLGVTWVLGTKAGSSAEAPSALSH